MDFDLHNKTALVTGSSRGTGFVIARELSREGAKVLVHGIEAEQATQAAAEIEGAIPVYGDITSDAGTKDLISQINNEVGQLDLLINNYGTAEAGQWSSLTSTDWLRMYEINTLSVMRVVQGTLPLLRQAEQARIVNLGTVGSTRPNNRMPHYYASKGALANLTVSLAKELSGTGITVNLVSPGLIRTPEVEQAYLARASKEGWGDTWEQAEAKIVEKYNPNPIGRIATREEVAHLVVFLCSRQASFINGQNIRVDGGALDIV